MHPNKLLSIRDIAELTGGGFEVTNLHEHIRRRGIKPAHKGKWGGGGTAAPSMWRFCDVKELVSHLNQLPSSKRKKASTKKAASKSAPVVRKVLSAEVSPKETGLRASYGKPQNAVLSQDGVWVNFAATISPELLTALQKLHVLNEKNMVSANKDTQSMLSAVATLRPEFAASIESITEVLQFLPKQ